jgi:O-methyltransferase involved in polyketide biosynthesis
MNIDNARHEKVSPTAWATAHARTFTDIPYSKEFFDLLEKKRRELGQQDLSVKMKDTSITLLIEARYKMIDKILRESDSKQILEIASGLCQRGLIMTADPQVTYVEMDLPTILAEKKEMVEELEASKNIKRNNLYLEPGNALSIHDMETASRHFDRAKPLAIVCEGLLRYLSFDEKAVVAKNIRALLEKFGGIWVTPDVSLRRFVVRKDSIQREKFNAEVEKATGVEIENNLFRDKQHALDFFKEQGFDVEERSYAEIEGQLTCPQKLDISKEEIDSVSKNAVLLVMRVRK